MLHTNREEGIQVKLTIKPGDSAQSHSISFDDDRVSVGRSPSADIQLPFSIVSSHHLTFARREGTYWVRDEGSTNGTKLDGSMLEPDNFQPLRNGSTLQIVDLVIDIAIRKPTAAVEDFTLAQTGTMARKMLGEALDAGGDDLAFFEVLNGPHQGERLKVPDDLDHTSLGSASDCILRVPGPEVPGHAIEISCEPTGFVIEPVDGVESYHNGSALEGRTSLASGDRVAFGQQSLLFHDPLESQLQELDSLSGAKPTGTADSASSPSDTGQAEALESTDTAETGERSQSNTAVNDSAEASAPSSSTSHTLDGAGDSGSGPQPSPDGGGAHGDPGDPVDDPRDASKSSSRGWGLLELFVLLITLISIVGVTVVMLVVFELI